MAGERYNEEFKIAAVKQVTEHGYSIADVAQRLGITTKSLYNWRDRYGENAQAYHEKQSSHEELRKLKAELKRVTEERDILKGGRRVLCCRVKEKYTFIKSRTDRYSVRTLCRTLEVHPSGFYAWLANPESIRQKVDEYLLGFIKQFWLESGCVYGYRKIHKDLKHAGEHCGKTRVHRLMQQAQIQAERGYNRKTRYDSGELSTVAPNLLNREFDVSKPNTVWVTDITYIRTYEGWLFLAVIIDLFSRQVVGWSMSERINTDLVLNAITMACWRRKPKGEVIVHSDQGCQYTSYDWQSMLKANNLTVSMSRRGNCHDNACAESFFALLKRERIRRKIYRTREEGKADIFNYIELFYNSTRRHGNNSDLSPRDYENNYFLKQMGV
ncbi:IS3 family transposase [Thalassolituus oleivorans]|nr:IS3 family transposase [Thalassolituus oleivorans]